MKGSVWRRLLSRTNREAGAAESGRWAVPEAAGLSRSAGKQLSRCQAFVRQEAKVVSTG